MFCKNLPTPDDVKLSKFRLNILIKKKKKKKKKKKMGEEKVIQLAP